MFFAHELQGVSTTWAGQQHQPMSGRFPTAAIELCTDTISKLCKAKLPMSIQQALHESAQHDKTSAATLMGQADNGAAPACCVRIQMWWSTRGQAQRCRRRLHWHGASESALQDARTVQVSEVQTRQRHLLFDDMHFIIVLPLALDHVAGFRLQVRPLLRGHPAIQPHVVGQFLLFCYSAALIMHL